MPCTRSSIFYDQLHRIKAFRKLNGRPLNPPSQIRLKEKISSFSRISSSIYNFNPLQPSVALPYGFLMFSGSIEKQHWAVMC